MTTSVPGGGTTSLSTCAPPGDISTILQLASRFSVGSNWRPARSTCSRLYRRRSANELSTTAAFSDVICRAASRDPPRTLCLVGILDSECLTGRLGERPSAFRDDRIGGRVRTIDPLCETHAVAIFRRT